MLLSLNPMVDMEFKSSQVNTLPKAKSQAKDKRAKDGQKYAALRCKVGVARPGFEVWRRMSRVAFRGISWRFFSLVKKTLNRHRAGFEPQRASPFMKWVKASKILGKAVLARTMIPVFVLPLVVLASSTSGDQMKSLHCADHHSIRIGDERERLVTA